MLVHDVLSIETDNDALVGHSVLAGMTYAGVIITTAESGLERIDWRFDFSILLRCILFTLVFPFLG